MGTSTNSEIVTSLAVENGKIAKIADNLDVEEYLQDLLNRAEVHFLMDEITLEQYQVLVEVIMLKMKQLEEENF